MDTHSLTLLQFNDVLEMIARFALGEEGRSAVLALRPVSNADEIKKEKKLGDDFLQLLQKDSAPPLQPRPPLAHFFDDLQKSGRRLDLEHVYSVGRLTREVKELQSWLNAQNETHNSIHEVIETLPDIEAIHARIFSFITKDGDLQAIPSLIAIERNIQKLEQESQNIMRSFFSDTKTRDMLQSTVPALRDGRQVLAIKANFKGRINGIIHEYSQTGQTFYLEPESVVQKNNDILFAKMEYERELNRLLREITDDILKHYDDLHNANKVLLKLECLYAVAQWGKKHRCVFAQESNDTVNFFLQEARHPLLSDSAIPIDIRLLAPARMMIITGPNTGGKTVSLKTVALFALLNQSAIPIPAGEDSRLPFFDYIACDIGDEQSLDDSLSTFSAHMKNIGGMLEQASENSLLIFDELGSGTDPQEGGALAMAILDSLIKRKSMTFVSSHHGALKNYGFSHTACINASVEFNSETGTPTYRILSGVPGESHAIDIAQLNGISADIIAQAKEYIGGKQSDVSALIKGLSEKYEILNREEDAQKKATEALAREKQKHAEKVARLRQKEVQLREDGYKEFKQVFDEQRKGLENLVRLLKEGEITKEKTRAVKKWIANTDITLNEELTAIKKEKDALRSEDTPDPRRYTAKAELREGMSVYIQSYKKNGTLIRKEKNGRWQVSLGSLKISVKQDDIFVRTTKKPASQTVHVQLDNKGSTPPATELRLLGMRYEDAQKALQQYIDNVCIYNLKECAIIHGKGNGILQTMVHDYLKSLPFVHNFDFARPEHGGTGKTLVFIE